MTTQFEDIRLLEALLFASSEPLPVAKLQRHFAEGCALEPLLEELAGLYANRGVNLVRVGDAWAFRTAADLAPAMTIEKVTSRKLSRVAMETLAIIAYHQPVTRAEVEEIRGVALSKGTLDILLEIGWVRPRGRRRTPGKPVTWGTTTAFLDHFGLSSLDDLPGFEELKAAGLIDARPAVVAMGQHGKLLNAEEAEAEREEEDPLEEGDDPLRADFGDDLVPETEDNGESAAAEVVEAEAAAEEIAEEEIAEEEIADGADGVDGSAFAADESSPENADGGEVASTGPDDGEARKRAGEERSVAALQAELKEALGG
jgi:segregation and condensation protein B